MKINMLSETINIKNGKEIAGNGVHSAFLDVYNSLKKIPNIEVHINSKKECDIIHSHTIGPKYFFMTRKKKYKTLVSAHVVSDSMVGSIILSKYWLPLFKWWIKKAYNRASTVLAVSPNVKNDLEKMKIKSKIVFLPNSINREKFKKNREEGLKFRERYNINSKDFVILSVGQIQTRKGVKDFVEVAKKFPDIKFVWCGNRPFGKATSGYQETENLIKNSPSNVIFTGFVERDEMNKVLNMSDLFFFPSFQENHPVALIEAASCNIPLLLRDIPEYEPTFFDNYLKGKNNDDFIKLIDKCFKNRNFLKEYEILSENIAKIYDVKVIVEKLLKEYEEVRNNY